MKTENPTEFSLRSGALAQAMAPFESHAEAAARWMAEDRTTLGREIVEFVGAFIWGRDVSDDMGLPLFLDLCAKRSPRPEIFWGVLDRMWEGLINAHCRDWSRQAELLQLMRSMHAPRPGVPIRLFRGCLRDRVRGISWTTNRGIAAIYSRSRRDSVIAEADFPSEAIFVRRPGTDFEVLVDPDGLTSLVMHEVRA